jgi:hypothetical protein
MKTLHAVLFCATASCCLPTWAQEDAIFFISGNELHGALVNFKSTRQNLDGAKGVGYVMGVHDALNGRTSAGYCFQSPKNVTSGQLSDVVLKYLEDNPQLRHYSGNSLVSAALAQSFPCRR